MVIDMYDGSFLRDALHRAQANSRQPRHLRLAMPCLQQNLDLVSLQHTEHSSFLQLPLRLQAEAARESFTV
jgi:hypothetical protein